MLFIRVKILLKSLPSARLPGRISNRYLCVTSFDTLIGRTTISTVPKHFIQSKRFDEFKSSLVKSKVMSYINRYLPRFRIGISFYNGLITNKRIIEYFKRYYPFQCLTNIEKFLKRSHYYDSSFINKIKDQISLSRKVFLENIAAAQDLMSNNTKVTISEEEHLYGLRKVFEDIFHSKVTSYRPTSEEVISQINLKASSGLPLPWVSKRQLVDNMLRILELIKTSKFDLLEFVNQNNDLCPLTAAFVRNQIRDSGHKSRLVFAVAWAFVVIETFFNISLSQLIKIDKSHAIHGYTQPELSVLSQEGKGKYTLCIDYERFDQRIPLFVLSSVGLLVVHVLCLNGYLYTLYMHTYAFFLTMPVFHPTLGYKHKYNGISSGSGFTSIFGSLSNYYMLNIAMRRYCYMHNINLESSGIAIYVSSDDTMIFSNFKIDAKKFLKILFETFGMTAKIESESGIDSDLCYFLGSRWESGKPYRNINRMFARILFGSGDYPKLTDLQLFQSRCYEILGNSCEYGKIYKTFKVPYPKNVFRFSELMDYNTRAMLQPQLMGYESRGIFQPVILSEHNASNVWLTR